MSNKAAPKLAVNGFARCSPTRKQPGKSAARTSDPPAERRRVHFGRRVISTDYSPSTRSIFAPSLRSLSSMRS
jgi:hypothetical protein